MEATSLSSRTSGSCSKRWVIEQEGSRSVRATPPRGLRLPGIPHCAACSVAPLPRAFPRLADQERRVGTRPWPILLDAAVVYLGDIEVALLVGRHPVHSPHAAGILTPTAPRVQEVSVQVEAEDLVCALISRPQLSIARD